MTLPGPSSEQKQQKQNMLLKQTLMAPTWTKINAPYIVFCGESDYDTLRAQF